MSIPTEQIGSIPRPRELLDGIAAFAAGAINQEALDAFVNGDQKPLIHGCKTQLLFPRLLFSSGSNIALL